VNPKTGETNNPFNGFLPAGYRSACNRSEPYRFESELGSPIADLESYGTWGVLDWDLGRAGPLDLGLRDTGSWREQVQRVRGDLDMTRFPAFTSRALGGTSALEGEPAFQQQVQQEVELSAMGWDDRLSLVSGAFLYWEDADEEAALLFLPGNALLDSFGGSTVNTNLVSNRTWALTELVQPGYDVVDLRLAFDFNAERSQVAFWMKNAGDAECFTNALSSARLTGSVVRYYAPPRTVGVELSQRFCVVSPTLASPARRGSVRGSHG